jgi:hypothetical protein
MHTYNYQIITYLVIQFNFFLKTQKMWEFLFLVATQYATNLKAKTNIWQIKKQANQRVNDQPLIVIWEKVYLSSANFDFEQEYGIIMWIQEIMGQKNGFIWPSMPITYSKHGTQTCGGPQNMTHYPSIYGNTTFFSTSSFVPTLET